jgi:hypothetical protein
VCTSKILYILCVFMDHGYYDNLIILYIMVIPKSNFLIVCSHLRMTYANNTNTLTLSWLSRSLGSYHQRLTGT